MRAHRELTLHRHWTARAWLQAVCGDGIDDLTVQCEHIKIAVVVDFVNRYRPVSGRAGTVGNSWGGTRLSSVP